MWFIPSWTNRFKPHPYTRHLSILTSSPSNNVACLLTFAWRWTRIAMTLSAEIWCFGYSKPYVMLGLHYVPGSHGSHGSQKRSSPWCFCHFCLCVQVLLSLATFSHGLSRSAVTEARRRATVCHGWFYVSSRPVTFWWDLSRFVTLRSSSATSIKFC